MIKKGENKRKNISHKERKIKKKFWKLGRHLKIPFKITSSSFPPKKRSF